VLRKAHSIRQREKPWRNKSSLTFVPIRLTKREEFSKEHRIAEKGKDHPTREKRAGFFETPPQNT